MRRLLSIRSANHQDLFVQRYDWLLSQALRLTGHDRNLSEDLVQEAFVQFVMRAPELPVIENLGAYLYAMVRNMHLSYVRRAGRQRTCSLSMFDYEPAAALLHAGSDHTRLAACDELRRVCEWACRRKETSKAGSILLLRFVHGYTPGEIALIMRSPARAVDDWLHIARREAASELARSATVGAPPLPARGRRPGESSADIVAALRARVFAASRTPCVPRHELTALYRGPDKSRIPAAILAHLVSCPACLDAVAKLLRLRRVSERDPRDTLGPHDRGPDGPGKITTGPGRDLPSRLRRRLHDVVGHRPTELRVAVNGFVLGAQRISAELSEQTIAVNIEEPIAFVEVFSEHDVRLLYVDVTCPPDGAATQSERLELSDGRSLTITLDFAGPWPTLNVTYLDPSFASDAVPAAETAPAADHVTPAARPRWARRAREWASGHVLGRPLVLRTAFGVAGVLVAAALFGIFTNRALVAAELLRQSGDVEDRYLREPGVLTHRVLYVEELEQATGKLLGRHRVDVWRDGVAGPLVRRYYTNGDRLVAGEWIARNGERSIYAAGQPMARENGFPPAQALATGQVWRLDLTVRAVAGLLRQDRGAARARGGRYELSFGPGAIVGAPGVEGITLSLDVRDRRLVEATFLVRERKALRLFRLSEHRAEQLPAASVPRAVFTPDAELLPAKVMPASPLARVPGPGDLLNLTVDAFARLDAAGATLGEQVTVEPSADGLRVEGVVETMQRKRQLQATLGSLAAQAGVHVDIRTAAEGLGRAGALRSPVVVRDFTVASTRIPAFVQLSDYLATRAEPPVPADQIDERVGELATRLLDQARRALLHSRAIERFVARVPARSLRRLDEVHRLRWRAMAVEHLSAVATGTAALAADLQPIFFPSASSTGPLASRALGPDDFAREVARLNDATARQDRLLREVLTVSDRPVDSVSRTAEKLRESLDEARQLAEQLRASASRF